ncbi:hypothetical protein [Edaphobacter albus]|uniref:hypothetical protein n=1 Tax=Edaphobacter sp. 4G125 TaxID=2763071 RepID=UPI0016478250|nr:hypothetical protein [Edaphobacter sp. 4G125]QNI37477.1 hypothetical protein H7846_04005 [Edaphobacter sp. 4G125]
MADTNLILAEHAGLGEVRICGCNSIHLRVGPVTITLAPEAFAQTAILIREAMESLSVLVAAGELETQSQTQYAN